MSMKNFRMQKCFGQLQGFRKEVVLQVEANMAICKAPALASHVSMEAQSEKGSVPFKSEFFRRVQTRGYGASSGRTPTQVRIREVIAELSSTKFSRLRHSNPVVEISSMLPLLDYKKY